MLVTTESFHLEIKIIATFKHTTSIFDDFAHYEKRQEEEEAMRRVRVQNFLWVRSFYWGGVNG